MTIETNLEDLMTLLTDAPEPQRSAAAGRLLAALIRPGVTPAMAHAAREIAEALSMATEHANFLAGRTEALISDQPPR